MKKIIIHTNEYAGNFEREMCAYTTGHIGECGVGTELVENDIKELFNDYIIQVENDRNCKRPVAIYPNPRYSNNGLGHNFDATDKEQCEIAKQKHIDYIKNDKLKRIQETIKFYKGTKHDMTYHKKELELVEREIENYSNIPATEIPTYPAYNSVCIYIADNTPENLIELVKERLNDFIKLPKFQKIIIEGVEIEEEDIVAEPKIDSNDELKVKVVAYKDHIIIETIDPDKFDKDFSAAESGRIGCSLSNPNKLGISNEAYGLLCKIKTCGDAIGDFMWDKNSFGWIGGVYSIKNLKSVGDRSFRVQSNYITIDNEVTDDMKNAVEKMLKPIEIEYDDVKNNIWLEFRKSKDDYNLTICFHKSHLYNGEVVLNAPEDCVKNNGDSIDVIVSDDYKDIIATKISSLFNIEYEKPKSDEDYIKDLLGKINDPKIIKFFTDRNRHGDINIKIKADELMVYLDKFFEIGFFNNIMNPRNDYWRLTHSRLSFREYVDLLDTLIKK